MNISHIARAAAVVLFAAPAAQAAALPVVKHMLADKNADYDLAIDYPQTGMKAIDDDLVQSVKAYAADFRREAKGARADSGRAYTLEAHYDVVRNDADGFAVKFDAEIDMAGAHPNEDIWTANYLRADGWRIYLPELFDGPRALPKISAAAIADLDRRLTTGAEPVSDKDWVARGAAPVGTNFAVFALMPHAIHFWFPPYAVASFAAGPQETEIPLAPLRAYLRPDPRAPAASFDCVRAASPTERAICADVALARLDRAVAEAYATALTEANDDGQKTAQRTRQRAWLGRRNDACKTQAGAGLIACLTGVYRERLASFQPGQ
ncbi:MAG: DUF3298 domain-containing protein [Rhizomicrobium sp.]|jgi:uncharacterized protein YecT (DUF1311 family)